ncbi:hypothetical protein Droror1_Dr00026313 [Drosera rotundifolia]
MNSLTTVCAAAVSSIPTTTLHSGAGRKISISITPTKSLSCRSLSFKFAAPNKKKNSSLPISTRLAAAGKGRISREAWEERELIEESAEDVGADDDVILDDEEEFEEDELFDDEDELEDEFGTEDEEVAVGDGAAGGGIKLAGTWWDKEALAIAEELCNSLDGGVQIYAFRTFKNGYIQLRIEKLSAESYSPDINDIEAFSIAYRARLDEAELTNSIPDNISLEVSSPGDDRVVRVPDDLERFKHKTMHVKYVIEALETGKLSENDGIFKLVSYDLETRTCTWGLADVRVNREKSGKGRTMSKKQREWRLSTPFERITMIRLHPVW